MAKTEHHFLHFTRKEKNGTILLLIIILLIISLPFLYSIIFPNKIVTAGEFKNELASLKIKSVDSSKNFYSKNSSEKNYAYHVDEKSRYSQFIPGKIFYFDPNTLSADEWMKLGVKEKTAGTIIKYISKGGRFKEPADIKKIWGLPPQLTERLLPYVRIAVIDKTKKDEKRELPVYAIKENKKRTLQPIDINNADTASFIALPGIGSKLAQRIISFREKMGGFYSIEQVSETFGLPDSTFQLIKPYLQLSLENIKKININTATLDELKIHPYIRYQIANAIISFRTSHGKFATIEDIKKIMIITNEIYIKVAPYLTVQ